MTVSHDLRTLFELEPHAGAYALEIFISDRLYEAGIWGQYQSSDGIVHIRVLEAEFDRLRICGRIYEIDSTLHPFWLELERPPSGTTISWMLYLDVVAQTLRHSLDAILLFDRASDLTWRVSLAGTAEVRDGTLVPVT